MRYRGALEYDWRTRFHARFDVLDDDGPSWPWGELWRLVEIVGHDPSSQLAAAMSGWGHPVSREWLVLADLWDVLVAVNTHKGASVRHPRPWAEPAPGTHHICSASLPQSVIRRALAEMGH
jgi:hypothetical protein